MWRGELRGQVSMDEYQEIKPLDWTTYMREISRLDQAGYKVLLVHRNEWVMLGGSGGNDCLVRVWKPYRGLNKKSEKLWKEKMK